MNVHNVRGRSMTQRMINVVGVDSIHGSIQSNKLWATPVYFGLGTGGWAKDNGFLSRHCSMGVL
jgi:hypothetical protein